VLVNCNDWLGVLGLIDGTRLPFNGLEPKPPAVRTAAHDVFFPRPRRDPDETSFTSITNMTTLDAANLPIWCVTLHGESPGLHV
jgi:hypothetical protein